MKLKEMESEMNGLLDKIKAEYGSVTIDGNEYVMLSKPKGVSGDIWTKPCFQAEAVPYPFSADLTNRYEADLVYWKIRPEFLIEYSDPMSADTYWDMDYGNPLAHDDEVLCDWDQPSVRRFPNERGYREMHEVVEKAAGEIETTEMEHNSLGFNERFKKIYDEEYKRLYNGGEIRDEKYLDRFDRKLTAEDKVILNMFSDYRGDIISSDREVMAFMYANDEMKKEFEPEVEKSSEKKIESKSHKGHKKTKEIEDEL